MAMAACKECTHEVSTTAKTCPRCGAQAPTGAHGKQVAGLVYLALIGAAFWWIWGLLTPEASNTVTVSKAEYGDRWPLTVSEGRLRCESTAWVLFEADGVTYAVNGTARGHAKRKGWSDANDIWRDSPSGYGKVVMTRLIERGLQLCEG